MTQQGTVRLRSTSMQSRSSGDSGYDRIRSSRFDGNALEAARTFVMQQLKALPNDCILEIEFSIDPSGLLDVLAELDAPALVEKISRRRWVLFLRPPGERELLDLCDLEAPVPMERILEAAAKLQPGEMLIARPPCFPRPLLEQLDRRGLEWEAAEAMDSSGLVWIGRPA